MKVIRLSAAALTAVLAACSGGGAARQSLVPPTAIGQSPASGGRSSATFTILIPLAGRTIGSQQRKTDYFSANTASFTVQIVSVNGQTYSGQQPHSINTGPAMPNCSTNAMTLSCTGTIDVPVGSDVLAVTATDGSNNSGHTLSMGQVTAQISPTAANAVTVTLGGVVAGVKVSFSATQPVPGSPQTIPVTVTALDCSGATIIGPGNYTTAITLTNTDKSGSASLSATTVSAPTQAVTLAWDGSNKLQFAGITGSVPLGTVPCGNPFGGSNAQFQTGYFLPHPEPPYLWTTQYAGGSASMVAYPLSWLRNPGSSAQVRPGPVIIVPGGNQLYVAGVDHAGNVYSSYSTNDGKGNAQGAAGIYKFSAGSTFAATPAVNISNASIQAAGAKTNAQVVDLAVDPSGNIFIVRGNFVDANGNANADLMEFPAANYTAGSVVFHDTNNNVLNAPNGMGADGSDNIFVANASSQNPAASGYISEFPAGAAVKSVALPKDAQGNYQNATGFGFDGSGHVYVGFQQAGHDPSVSTYSIASFPAAATGGFSFLPKYLGNSNYSKNAVGADSLGYVYTSSLYGIINVFAPGASGSATPIASFQCCIDPTTLDGTIAVPAGLTPPTNGVISIAVQP